MMGDIMAAFLGSLVLAAVHALSPVLTRLPERHQALLSSFSGGVGLAYVFLYLLFELAKFGAPKIHALLPLGPEPLETLFILILGALSIFHLLQSYVEKSPDPRDDYLGFAVLFLVYNLLAGTGVVEEARGGALNLGLYVVALSLHLLFNDTFLSHICPVAHRWPWRLGLAAMPVMGCAFAAGFALPEGILYGLLAVVAGGTIINVLHHELPRPSSLHPASFVTGVVIYAGLIAALWRF
ncbi:MAG TPA: hypothetical protein VJ576_17415 [Rhodocyclaceae bacterium]|nr:hypothetical protein [Rhodocyclaceae bacterium]